MARAIDCTNGDIISRKVKGEISKNEYYAIFDAVKLKNGFTLL